MEHMEQKMDEQKEGALHNQKEAYERISELELENELLKRNLQYADDKINEMQQFITGNTS